ncbi:MAG TPA: reverse transcriptase family protein [Pirellulales bacterium]|nr:reverse transcriptase family protein [Pirellulales bacterium]
MLNLGRLKHLANVLGVWESDILRVLVGLEENPSAFVTELTVWPAKKEKRSRDVISPRRRWRLIQQRIYKRLLLRELQPTPYIHGGVRGRNAASNARTHIGNVFGFVTDITDFFPSIDCHRVNELFLRHGSGYQMAKVLTRLCTYEFHLAQGLTTSSILANEIFKSADLHIARACNEMELRYSRYVDDIAVSGKYDLKRSGVKAVIQDVVERFGFKLNLAVGKTDWGRLDCDISITGARVTGNHLNPSRDFVSELQRLIRDHQSLAADGHFDGPFLVEGELVGKAYHACYLNSGLRRSILSELGKIKWDAVMNYATRRNLCRRIERIAPRGEPRPSAEIPLALSQGWQNTVLQPTDPNLVPWE